MPLGIDRIGYTNKFRRRYRRLDPGIRAEVDALIRELAEDRLSPGRKLKPMKGHDRLYELRVNYQFRLTFRLRADHVAELAAAVHMTYSIRRHDA